MSERPTLAKTKPRKRLTLRDMVTIAQRQTAAPILCCLCIKPLGDGPVIDEHLVARGVGGGEEIGNRGIAHKDCSDIKTNGPKTKAFAQGDKTEIAKADRIIEARQAFAAKVLAKLSPSDWYAHTKGGRGFLTDAPAEKVKRKIPSRGFQRMVK